VPETSGVLLELRRDPVRPSETDVSSGWGDWAKRGFPPEPLDVVADLLDHADLRGCHVVGALAISDRTDALETRRDLLLDLRLRPGKRLADVRVRLERLGDRLDDCAHGCLLGQVVFSRPLFRGGPTGSASPPKETQPRAAKRVVMVANPPDVGCLAWRRGA
jgi:hypothetical protein